MAAVFRMILSALACLSAFAAPAAAKTSDALCPAQEVVIYFLPGEIGLDQHDEAIVDMFAARVHGCRVDMVEVDSFADTDDQDVSPGDVSAARAQTVLSALAIRGVTSNAVKVRLHLIEEAGAALARTGGRRTEVRIRLRPHVGPMS